ncbi:NAD(P)/FAD-dependent oxidoreductase [Siccirubricoccus sp. G192]|uniref:NAD(P)/FAD-dependent oxidoreductase n=1 Tax=Siccirubricoccus sp. G192 TaxID=2849651 RepID=UPI001C2C3EFC|nr:NAD(P)/FAD-dependent oxidoreductase [Siccirubricoccus sp. G192]MBV1799484.1 NAD(P)/FAD-dependent oxidoreductase [Siccirubricoccus sp. G192]
MAGDRTGQFDVAIIGAGAAGLLCAISAGRRGRRVLLLDHAESAGKKILISGGGRCNFTNLHCAPDRFISANPHFCKSALARYTQHDFIALVQRHRIAWHEKTLGQLFCDGSARAILAMLLEECAAVGVELRLGQRIGDISRAERFRLATETGDVTAEALVLATGGLSIPKMGATGFAHDVARRFALPLAEPRPGLVPLTFGGADLALMQPLSGVALEVVASCGRRAFREAMLFTHRGLSGPAILQISSYWREGQEILLDLLPGTDAAGFLLDRKRSRPRAEPRTILAELLPQRLAQSLAETQLPAQQPIGGLPDRALHRLAALLKGWRLRPSGSEGYAKAEVTLGGVDTAALSSRTMQAHSVPGLFVIGEAVDVTGWLGGYNFQWAWSSGWVAGEAA